MAVICGVTSPYRWKRNPSNYYYHMETLPREELCEKNCPFDGVLSQLVVIINTHLMEP